MKVLILIFLLPAVWCHAGCLQDNAPVSAGGRDDIRQLEGAVQSFEMAMRNEFPKEVALIIRLESLNPRVNADIVKHGNELTIQVLGGMLRHEAMTPETLMLLLCHEVGHFAGGPPLKSRNGWSSTEGQSDFYSGLKCARQLGFDEATFVEAAVSLTGIYAQVARESLPQLDRCDERTVERTNFGYPGAQCRLDTLMAGWRGSDRPRCWFKD